MTLLTAERKELSLMNSLTRENSTQGMREVKHSHMKEKRTCPQQNYPDRMAKKQVL